MIHLPQGMLTGLLTVVALVFTDAILGAVSALMAYTFSWAKLGQFVETNLMPYLVGLLALAVVSLLPTGQQGALQVAFYAALAASDVKFLADIVQKIASFGVPVQKAQG